VENIVIIEFFMIRCLRNKLEIGYHVKVFYHQFDTCPKKFINNTHTPPQKKKLIIEQDLKKISRKHNSHSGKRNDFY